MFIQELLSSLIEAPGKFIDVALHDPISAVLIAVAAVILIASVGFFAVLVLGAIGNLLTPSSGGRRHQPGQ